MPGLYLRGLAQVSEDWTIPLPFMATVYKAYERLEAARKNCF